MSRQFNTAYTIVFSTTVCIVCSLVVSSMAVGLKTRQQENAALDLQKNVLMAAGMIEPGKSLSRKEIGEAFGQIEQAVIDLKTGEVVTDIDAGSYDQQRALKDADLSIEAPTNTAGIRRLPKRAKVYKVMKDGKLDQVVLPIEGKGLWSTLYGFLSIDSDTTTIRGITFYSHGETPGLGGEIDNPQWKAQWNGRKAYSDDWKVDIQVIKGAAGSAEEDPHRVDGISGATITCKGVSKLVAFWMGENGFGPYLKSMR